MNVHINALMQAKQTRFDIQFLRGIAVLVILLYHSLADYFPSAYIAIDIFLVVSGFLITGLITKALENDNFSFVKFYANRIKRLMPAAYLTIFVTLLLSPKFLNPGQLTMLDEQVAGAVAFFANFVFAAEYNYFSAKSEYGPFLHFWSLSLEEQFYFLLPLLLFLSPKRWRALMLTIIAIGSFIILYKAYLFLTPTQSYFLLPTRIWQFTLGGIAFFILRTNRFILPHYLSPIFCIVILILCMVAPSPSQPSIIFHPHYMAILTSLLTFAIMLVKPASYWSKLIFSPIMWIGNISYSLYLVHWPILAFYRNSVARSELLVSEAVVLIILSITCAALLHYSVEKPFHRQKINKLYIPYIYTIIGAIALIFMSFWIAKSAPPSRDLTNFGLAQECNMAESYKPDKKCTTIGKKDTKILLYGDSFAMHWARGLASSDYGVTQVTKAGCAPIYNIVPIFSHDNDITGLNCIKFNESVREFIRNDHRHDVIAISTSWHKLVSNQIVMKNLGGVIKREAIENDEIIASLKIMADEISSLGKKVILIAPPPRAIFNVAKCHEQKKYGKLSLYNSDCSITPDLRGEHDIAVRALLAEILEKTDIPIFSFDAILCKNLEQQNEICITKFNNVPLYFDEGHISSAGSIAIAKRSDLATSLVMQAK